jgi:LysM repeat protein
MDSTNVRTAPEIGQGLAQELNGAHDVASLKKAIQDTYDAHDTSSQTDWNTMSQILKNSVSLKQIGLGDFVLTGVDESNTGNPEIIMKDGNVNIAVDETGVAHVLPATMSTGDAFTAPAAPATSGDATTPPPAGTTADAPLAPAAPPTTAPTDSAAPQAAPATDAPSPASTAGDTTPSEDPATGVAPDGSFGQNGRKMVLSSDGTQGTYTVQPGDSLWTIAEDKLGVGDAANDPDFQTRVANLVAQLTSDNNISNPDMIYPGQQLNFTNLQNSAYDSSSYDAGSASSSTTSPSASDAAASPPPVIASSDVVPTSQDSSPDGSSSTDDPPVGQTPAQTDSGVSQPGSSSIAQNPDGPNSTPDIPNYNTVPLPPQDQDLTPPSLPPDAGTLSHSGSGDDFGS